MYRNANLMEHSKKNNATVQQDTAGVLILEVEKKSEEQRRVQEKMLIVSTKSHSSLKVSWYHKQAHVIHYVIIEELDHMYPNACLMEHSQRNSATVQRDIAGVSKLKVEEK